MSHYNYGIINGANESAPKLGAYRICEECILRPPTAGFAELNGRDALLPSRQSERLYAAKGS